MDEGILSSPSFGPPRGRDSGCELIDQNILRALGERRVYRALRRNGVSSAWDRLEILVARASTMIWEQTDVPGTELVSYCSFLARELEINEELDLPADEDAARLRSLAPRALDALDGIEQLVPCSLATTFGAIRAELRHAADPTFIPLAA